MNSLTTQSITPPSQKEMTFLRIFSKLLVFAVFLLIFAGALVTSNNAGLAVPDWPTSFGENMFTFHYTKWRGIIFYEHVHRLIASGIGFLTLVLTVVAWFYDRRRYMRVLTLLALILVIIQGVLGGLTVLYHLPLAVSTAHGVLGQSFFCLTIIIAYFYSDEFFAVREQTAGSGVTSLRKASMIAFGVVYVQLILGALMRHSEAGLAVPDFPQMGGMWIPDLSALFMETINSMRATLHLPPVDTIQVVLHLLHRGWAFVVTFFVLVLTWELRKTEIRKARSLAIPLCVVLCVQFLLGIVTVLSHRSPELTSLHVLGGAALLALETVVLLRVFGGSRIES